MPLCQKSKEEGHMQSYPLRTCHMRLPSRRQHLPPTTDTKPAISHNESHPGVLELTATETPPHQTFQKTKRNLGATLIF